MLDNIVWVFTWQGIASAVLLVFCIVLKVKNGNTVRKYSCIDFYVSAKREARRNDGTKALTIVSIVITAMFALYMAVAVFYLFAAVMMLFVAMGLEDGGKSFFDGLTKFFNVFPYIFVYVYVIAIMWLSRAINMNLLIGVRLSQNMYEIKQNIAGENVVVAKKRTKRYIIKRIIIFGAIITTVVLYHLFYILAERLEDAGINSFFDIF